jgi:phospholipid/cholesterol/gamma-HCH transport system permease protein
MPFLAWLGRVVTRFIQETGRVARLFFSSLFWTLRPPLRARNILRQMEVIGVNSLPVVAITALFTGATLALQSVTGFRRFNAEELVGTVVALAMCRELGPVLTGLIVAGRVGSGMAAELGTMRVTEQIDALDTMAVSPVHYLVVPRLLAGTIMLPFLTVGADLLGILGGYFVSVGILKTNSVVYVRRTIDYLELNDIFTGLVKAAVFGLIIALIGCYQGFYAQGGAEGVGKATTRAVVVASMVILLANYILTAIFF